MGVDVLINQKEGRDIFMESFLLSIIGIVSIWIGILLLYLFHRLLSFRLDGDKQAMNAIEQARGLRREAYLYSQEIYKAASPKALFGPESSGSPIRWVVQTSEIDEHCGIAEIR